MFTLRTRSLLDHPIFSKLDTLARQSGFVRRRSSKCDATSFLLGLIQCSIKGTSSLNHLSIALAGFCASAMSRQAMAKRFGPASKRFLQAIVGELLRSRTAPVLDCGGVFRRVLVQDTTVISMAGSNAWAFPNNGNCKGMTAGIKVDLVTELTTGQVLRSAMCNARDTDQKLSEEVLGLCRRQDLVIRDRGFFSLEVLEALDSRGAFWLSRLPASVGACFCEGVPLELMLERATGPRLELTIELGRQRVKARLVATRLDQQQADANRRHRRRESARHGTTPRKRGLIRDGWSLLVTNLPDEVESDQVYRLYSARWGIEIQFRGFKQACRIGWGLKHKAGPAQIEALVLAAMIFQLLSLELHTRLRRRHGGLPAKNSKARVPNQTFQISLEKLSDALAHHFLLLDRRSRDKPISFDLRHISHDRRSRPTLWQSVCHSLG